MARTAASAAAASSTRFLYSSTQQACTSIDRDCGCISPCRSKCTALKPSVSSVLRPGRTCMIANACSSVARSLPFMASAHTLQRSRYAFMPSVCGITPKLAKASSELASWMGFMRGTPDSKALARAWKPGSARSCAFSEAGRPRPKLAMRLMALTPTKRVSPDPAGPASSSKISSRSLQLSQLLISSTIRFSSSATFFLAANSSAVGCGFRPAPVLCPCTLLLLASEPVWCPLGDAVPSTAACNDGGGDEEVVGVGPSSSSSSSSSTDSSDDATMRSRWMVLV
mmetsp:Transcript_16535/g.45337  ORF Transcript_16535/g.45337 Transcript_16535/m.45337 type:complete len:283 (+) Transcript_16535:783-1631(+)